MSPLRSAVLVLALGGAMAAVAVPQGVARVPASLASLALGNDDAFAVFGLEPRENQIGGGAIRWTRPKAAFQFEGAGPGLVDIDLEVRGHRTEVTLIANGARIGSLLPGQGRFMSRIRLGGASLVVGIETDGFEAPGRRLGTQFVSLRIQPARTPTLGPGAIPVRLWAALGAVLLVSSVAQALSGLTMPVALLAPALFLIMVIPAGLWRSRWLFECALSIMATTAISALVSRRARGGVSSRGWLQVAVLMAITVHGVLPPSPLVIQSDAQLHGNKLAEVAQGNRFLTSRTDHRPPFDFPYGFSFYFVLTPFASSDSYVSVARHGAAFFSALAAAALAFTLGRVSAVLAAPSMLLWAFAPVNVRTMGFGNLNNVFAQDIFVLFLVSASVMSPGVLRAGLLTVLVALSATAHLSAYIVMVTLFLITLALAARGESLPLPRAERGARLAMSRKARISGIFGLLSEEVQTGCIVRRRQADFHHGLLPREREGALFKPLFAGVLLATGYFATFIPLILGQVPRLLGERGGSSGVFDPWRLPAQVMEAVGWPMAALLVLSALSGRARAILPLPRSLAATGLVLALVALVSPVEVRYMLAILPLLAIVAASVFDEGPLAAFPRQTLTAIIDVSWLRRLVSEPVMLPLAGLLLVLAVVGGVRALLGFMPLAGV